MVHHRAAPAGASSGILPLPSSTPDPEWLLDLGLLLLLGPLLLERERLLEPDLEDEEDIFETLLAINR